LVIYYLKAKMGIPSYFSYIIRNFPKIVCNIKTVGVVFHHLFLDCNSIIYDVARSNNLQKTDDQIIDMVIKKIDEYILKISPNNTVFITFDGVAPFAKMNQQRTRRYKTDYMAKISREIKISNGGDKIVSVSSGLQQNNTDVVGESEVWDTTKITPGTVFMRNLTHRMNKYYHNTTRNGAIIVVSGADIPGEGEHKIFQYIREKNMKEDNVIVYGLDSDLFMLSILNREYYKGSYIFREAPDFLKGKLIPETTLMDECYLIDVSLLASSILIEMGFTEPNRVRDYVFLCFFLGNDFLPHFPSLNIRTIGIRALLDIYNEKFKNRPDSFLINHNNSICWKNVEKILKRLSELEHSYLLNEYSIREKFDKWVWNEPKNTQDLEKMIQDIPIMYRSAEKYISPNESEWEKRYYNILFESSDISQICNNYFEGLEWVWVYYTDKCVDWKWCYKYNYGPLLSDLYKHSPYKQKIKICMNKNMGSRLKHSCPVDPVVQLAYVLPKSKLYLLPVPFRTYVENECSDFYNKKIEFTWAFTRYFWESHISWKDDIMDKLESYEVADSEFIGEG